jgi:hypothetical protein
LVTLKGTRLALLTRLDANSRTPAFMDDCSTVSRARLAKVLTRLWLAEATRMIEITFSSTSSYQPESQISTVPAVVLARRDLTLEQRILERMILDAHGRDSRCL